MNDNKWYYNSGNRDDIIISTRIRLARNLVDYPFPSRLDPEQKKSVNEEIRNVLFTDKEIMDNFSYIPFTDISTEQINSYVEHHIISPEYAKREIGKAIIINRDQSVSIMLCEEDHIRIQVMTSGFDLDSAYTIADRIDTILSKNLKIAFNERLGYLTECPTNLGTGMRASVMLHLYALNSTGAIDRLANSIGKIGLTLRGTYGEGSKALGTMYQLSNQITLGIDEKSALENLKNITEQIIKNEKELRATISGITVEDTAFRSLAILKNARIISSKEMVSLISNVRLGISEGYITDISMKKINTIYNDMMPFTLIQKEPEAKDSNQRDIIRAFKIRELLSQQD